MKFDIQKILSDMTRDESLMLTAGERQGMEDRLRQYMSFKPLPAPHSRVFVYTHSAVFRYAAAALILALASTGTVSYAAEGALPGDALYPVKIHVNENVRRALAQTPVARVEVESALASRRLNEAHELAKQKRLTREVRAALEEDFDTHVDRVEEETENVSEDGKDEALRAAARFESELEEHKARFEDNEDEDSHDFSERIDKRTKKLAEFRERVREDHSGHGGGDHEEDER